MDDDQSHPPGKNEEDQLIAPFIQNHQTNGDVVQGGEEPVLVVDTENQQAQENECLDIYDIAVLEDGNLNNPSDLFDHTEVDVVDFNVGNVDVATAGENTAGTINKEQKMAIRRRDFAVKVVDNPNVNLLSQNLTRDKVRRHHPEDINNEPILKKKRLDGIANSVAPNVETRRKSRGAEINENPKVLSARLAKRDTVTLLKNIGRNNPSSVTAVSKTKRRAKRHRKISLNPLNGNFKRYINRVLKSSEEFRHYGLSAYAADSMNCFMNDIFNRIADEAAKLVDLNKKVTLTERDIRTAVRLIVPGTLGNAALHEGTRALAAYKASVMDDEAVQEKIWMTGTKKITILEKNSSVISPNLLTSERNNTCTVIGTASVAANLTTKIATTPNILNDQAKGEEVSVELLNPGFAGTQMKSLHPIFESNWLIEKAVPAKDEFGAGRSATRTKGVEKSVNSKSSGSAKATVATEPSPVSIPMVVSMICMDKNICKLQNSGTSNNLKDNAKVKYSNIDATKSLITKDATNINRLNTETTQIEVDGSQATARIVCKVQKGYDDRSKISLSTETKRPNAPFCALTNTGLGVGGSNTMASFLNAASTESIEPPEMIRENIAAKSNTSFTNLIPAKTGTANTLLKISTAENVTPPDPEFMMNSTDVRVPKSSIQSIETTRTLKKEKVEDFFLDKTKILKEEIINDGQTQNVEATVILDDRITENVKILMDGVTELVEALVSGRASSLKDLYAEKVNTLTTKAQSEDHFSKELNATVVKVTRNRLDGIDENVMKNAEAFRILNVAAGATTETTKAAALNHEPGVLDSVNSSRLENGNILQNEAAEIFKASVVGKPVMLKDRVGKVSNMETLENFVATAVLNNTTSAKIVTLKTSAVQNKLKKSKRKRVRNLRGFKRYIYAVLRRDKYFEHCGISAKALDCVNSFMNDVFDRIVDEASILMKLTRKVTLTEKEIRTAVRLILPGHLGTIAINEAEKSLATYTISVNADKVKVEKLK